MSATFLFCERYYMFTAKHFLQHFLPKCFLITVLDKITVHIKGTLDTGNFFQIVTAVSPHCTNHILAKKYRHRTCPLRMCICNLQGSWTAEYQEITLHF